MSEEEKSRELSIRRERPFSIFQEMDKMFNELTRRFDEFWRPTRWPRFGSLMETEEGPLFRTPLTNIKDKEDHIEISAEMPGLDKGDIEVSISDGVLEIKGEMEEEEKEEKEGEVVRSEYRTSRYYRAFTLPENINDEEIDANLDKGILTVKVPKQEPEPKEKKKIEIK
ncbi:MAG: Hsp20/alpha crystallin family protein [Promethearchaeia archaeon]